MTPAEEIRAAVKVLRDPRQTIVHHLVAPELEQLLANQAAAWTHIHATSPIDGRRAADLHVSDSLPLARAVLRAHHETEGS